MSDPERQAAERAERQAIELAEQLAAELAASLDAAADDLERNGPVPAAEVRRTLRVLYTELGAQRAAE